MRWFQFLLTLFNLGFAIYLILITVCFASSPVPPLTFLWALIYLTLSMAIAHLYMLYMSNKIDDWYDVGSMNSITNLSIVSTLFCTAALAIHLGLSYYHKKQVFAVGNETLGQVLPLFAALVCSLAMFLSSIKFRKYIILCRSVELPAARPVPRNYRTNDY